MHVWSYEWLPNLTLLYGPSNVALNDPMYVCAVGAVARCPCRFRHGRHRIQRWSLWHERENGVAALSDGRTLRKRSNVMALSRRELMLYGATGLVSAVFSTGGVA